MRAVRDFEERWAEGVAVLGARDPILKGLVERYRGERLEPHGDVFRSLARAVVGQQISVPAAERIWTRVMEAAGTASPCAIARMGRASLGKCGLTRAKADCMAELAASFASPSGDAGCGRQTREALLAFRGVGPWTADMAAIFALGELDVLPLADLGLQRAAADLYGGPRSPERLAGLGEGWRPWRTVAAWYLWRHLDPVPVAY